MLINLDDDITGYTPISLGWNCGPAVIRAKTYGFSKTKGYLTCPFDLGVTPYNGLCDCILDGFDRSKFFNLRIEYDSLCKKNCILNEYDMWFNHESEKSNMDELVEWIPGKWEENNFQLFKERYNRRIQNFEEYINNNNVIFIIENTHNDINKIINIIKYKYPSLNFKIMITSNECDLYNKQHLHSPGFDI
jgi:hypothetical protein